MSLTVPAEWSAHAAMWVGFPSHADLWGEDLEAAQQEVADFALALADAGSERVRLLICGEAAEKAARSLIGDASGVERVRGFFGDVWLRDTGPIFTLQGNELKAASFLFNGWGGKYVLADDDTVAEQIASASGAMLNRHGFVVEGGALDHDGFGTVLTTRQCLLNPNRNRHWTGEAAAEAALSDALGARRVIWLGEGLVKDHTDGHVDNLARFVAPGVVVCPVAFGSNDPNAEIYDEAARALSAAKDARGVALQVVRIPSPGRIVDAEGEPCPASHMNFVIANSAIILPTYEIEAASLALDALQGLFPERRVIGLPAKALLTGGGSFHCITQQEPLP